MSDGANGEGSDDRYRLRPDQFPKRLELELDPALLLELEELSVRRGRSLGELIESLLARSVAASASACDGQQWPVA